MRRDPPIRFYLHGDAHEEQPGEFHCARCNGFFAVDHFDDPFHLRTKTAKLSQTLDSWITRSADPGPRFRPESATNLFSDIIDNLVRTSRVPNWTR